MSLSERVEKLQIKIDKIERKMDLIINKIDELSSKVGSVGESCDNMDNHIHFINGVYTTVRSPLEWIVNRTNTLMGDTHNNSEGGGDNMKQLPFK